MRWRVRTRTLATTDHTLIMGVVNVTPDSFSDGGAFVDETGRIDRDAAVRHGEALLSAGADILDIGGESTRPGAAEVGADEEWGRVGAIVEALASLGAVVSIDTSKPEVARAAVAAGAEIVNDVTALSSEAMRTLCAETGVGVVLMHMQGAPRTMQDDPRYGDVVAEVSAFLVGRAEDAVASGVGRRAICIDPGIGFGKALDHNLALLAHLDVLVATGYPVLVGASRKRFLGAILGGHGVSTMPNDRDVATGAVTALAVASGAAVIRVHDVVGTVHISRVADAIVRSR